MALLVAVRPDPSFNTASFAPSAHREIAKDHTNFAQLQENWRLIQRAGEHIVAGVDLPTLGNRGAEEAPKSAA